MGEYATCRYYVKGEEKNGLENYTGDEPEQAITFYKEANLLTEVIDSECDKYVLNKLDTGFIASCRSMDRTLTRSQALLCKNYWERCPFRVK